MATSWKFDWKNEISAICKWERSLFLEKKSTQDVLQALPNSDSGVMVSIVAFQAVDRGSIPCCRIIFYNNKKKKKKKDQKKKKKKRNRKKDMSEVGFEPTPTFVDQKALTHFDSGRITSLSLAP